MLDSTPEDLITRPEAAKLVGVSEMSIRRAIYAGQLVNYRKERVRSRFVSAAAVAELFKFNVVPATNEQ